MAKQTVSTTDRPFAPPDWPALARENRKVAVLKPHPRNPHVHPEEQIAAMAAGIKEFGIYKVSVLVDEKDTILAGHGMILACKRAGVEQIPVAVARGWTEAKKLAVVEADNRFAELATWNVQLRSENLAMLSGADFNMLVVGWDMPSLDLYLNMQTIPPIEMPPPPVPKDPVSRQGDMWTLGRSRVICGDCRDQATVTRLIGRQKIAVAFTSPPYAEQREYDEASGFRPVAPNAYVDWFAAVAKNVADNLSADGSWFVNIKPAADGLDTSLYVMDLVIAHVRRWGWHFATEFCWERNGVPKSVTRRFKNQFEPIYQFSMGDWKMRPQNVRHKSDDVPIPAGPGVGNTTWKNDQDGGGPIMGATKRRGSFGAYGTPNAEGQQGVAGASAAQTRAREGRRRGFPTAEGSQGTVEDIGVGLAYPGNRLPTFSHSHEATGHPAAFPVGLADFFVRAYSDRDDVIYDPFSGSGSTIIAAEQNHRIGVGCELSPGYTDVIVKRWEKFTGQVATLDGSTFEQVAKKRKNPRREKTGGDNLKPARA